MWKEHFMPYYPIRRRKRSLSEHQKQIRFWTGLSMTMSVLLFAVFFWYLNRQDFLTR
jgi:hypothetical protein